MLDWTKIDNDKTFQRLVNHLFALECNSPGFIPSSPYIGADGGWDGYYDGYYDSEKEEGIWSIQAKWTLKSFKDALPALKSDIKDELKKARENNAHHLRVATNAKLRVKQVQELQGLNKGEVTTLKVWHRTELERRIELQPFLRYYFFRSPQYPAFVPWNKYFAILEEDLLEIPCTEIQTFRAYIAITREFIQSGPENILLIHSPGGYGKSHLLRDIASRAHSVDPKRQPWVLNLGHRDIRQAIQEELLLENRHYLFICDDADRYLDDIKPILSLVKSSAGAAKTILSLRSSGFRAIHNIIRELRCEEIYREIRIAEWPNDDLIRLLRTVVQKQEVKDEDVIVAMYPNPYLIVRLGKQIRKDPTSDFKTFREKFVGDIHYDANKSLKDYFTLSESQINRLLINLACIVPFSKDHAEPLNDLAAKLDLKADNLRQILASLENAGVLRFIGSSVRFNPDMKGDLFLEYELEKDIHSVILQDLMESWLNDFPEKLFINLGASARYAHIPKLKEYISNIVRGWIGQIGNVKSYTLKTWLGLAEKIARIVPEECVNLLNRVLDLRLSGDDFLVPTMDDFGPVIEELLREYSLRDQVIQLIDMAASLGIKVNYDNYKQRSLIRRSVSPLYNNTHVILKTIDLLARWLGNLSEPRIELLSAALSELLGGTHRYMRGVMGRVEWGDPALKDTEDARIRRDKALEILSSLLTAPNLKAQLAAIEVASKIGTSMMTGLIPREDLPLSGKMAEERTDLVQEIGKLISPDADIQLLNRIENLFMAWWAQVVPGTDKVRDFLCSFPRDPEYIILRYYVSPDYAVDDFRSLDKNAPCKDRWSWFVRSIMHSCRELEPEHFKDVIHRLSKKYTAKEQVVDLLKKIDRLISPHDPSVRPPIITCWVNSRCDLFTAIRMDTDLWQAVPERFRNEIDAAISDNDPAFIYMLAEEVIQEMPDTSHSKLANFLILLSRQTVDISDIEYWLSRLIEYADPDKRARIIFYLRGIYKKTKDVDLALNIAYSAFLKEDELNDVMLGNLSFSLDKFAGELDTADEKVKKLFDSILMKLKAMSDLTWDAERLMKHILRDLDSLVDFIESRLAKFSQLLREDASFAAKYNPIPIMGFTFWGKYIDSYSDFDKLMNRAYRWYETGIIHRIDSLDHLLESLYDIPDEEEPYFRQCISEQLERGHVKKAALFSRYLSLNEQNLPLIVRVGEKAVDVGANSELRLLFCTEPSPIRRKRKDEQSSDDMARKNLFQKVCKITKEPRLKSFLNGRIQELDARIAYKTRLLEEIQHPRG